MSIQVASRRRSARRLYLDDGYTLVEIASQLPARSIGGRCRQMSRSSARWSDISGSARIWNRTISVRSETSR